MPRRNLDQERLLAHRELHALRVAATRPSAKLKPKRRARWIEERFDKLDRAREDQ